MTNEDAIKILNTLYSVDVYVNDALDLANKALETGEVYITGEDYNLYMEGYKAGKKDFEPKQGEWIVFYTSKKKKVFKCDKCMAVSIQGQTNFCHNCGASMKGGAENENNSRNQRL